LRLSCCQLEIDRQLIGEVHRALARIHLATAAGDDVERGDFF
jgi:hypothetical protein